MTGLLKGSKLSKRRAVDLAALRDDIQSGWVRQMTWCWTDGLACDSMTKKLPEDHINAIGLKALMQGYICLGNIDSTEV